MEQRQDHVLQRYGSSLYQNDEPVVEYHLWTQQWKEMLDNSKFSKDKWPLAYELLLNCGVKTKKVSSVSRTTETTFGIVTSLSKNLTKQSFLLSKRKAPVSLGYRGFFHLSDTGRQGLFCHHLYVAITVSFEIDTAVLPLLTSRV